MIEINPVDVPDEPIAQLRFGGDRSDDVVDETNGPLLVEFDRTDLFAPASEPDRAPTSGRRQRARRRAPGIPRRPPYSQIVTGVVRGTPDRLPRTVRRMSGPIGTPSASSGFATALK